MGHAVDRIVSRGKECGLTDEQICKVWAAAKKEAAQVGTESSEAVMLWALDHKVVCQDGSMGNELWVVIRGGWVTTVMVRGKGQTDANLRVDRVVRKQVNR